MSEADVIEDCGITAKDLAAAGTSDEVVAVCLLARLEPDLRQRLAEKYEAREPPGC